MPTSRRTDLLALVCLLAGAARAETPGADAPSAPGARVVAPATTDAPAEPGAQAGSQRADAPAEPGSPAATPAGGGPANSGASDEDAIAKALAADAASSEPAASPPPAPAAGGAPQSLNPDLSLVLDVAGAAFADHRLQTGEHDPSRNGANLQQLELTAGAPIDSYFRLDTHLVFHEAGVDLEETYGTTLDLPARLQARFELFLHRFGRANPTHPHTWAFVDQPL